MNSLFCRHNRFTADCPICSKGTLLDREPPERVKPAGPAAARPRPSRRQAAAAATMTRYPHVSAGPFEHDARVYEVRLEKVPGGLRLGEWRGGALERTAPVLPASALRSLAEDARAHAIAGFAPLPAGAEPVSQGTAASAGRAGDLREELRLERLDEPGLVRVARWVFWPGAGVGWELQDSPVMLPETRFEQLFSEAARSGLI
ncbi:MAG: hypothetical protein ACJ76Z_13055 [Thermoleophilaceae bacterium]